MHFIEKKKNLIEELSVIDTPLDRIEYLIECASSAPKIDEKFKNDEFLIRGCVSQLWLVPEFKNLNCYFLVDSDALITKGIGGVIADLYSETTPKEILTNAPDFLEDLGITQHLTPNRRNGLSNLWKRIKNYAQQHL